MFIAQASRPELSFWAAVRWWSRWPPLTSMGVAGIPAASVAIAVILSAVGLAAEGIGALLVLDSPAGHGAWTAINRVSPMPRAPSSSARLEGEKDVVTRRSACYRRNLIELRLIVAPESA